MNLTVNESVYCVNVSNLMNPKVHIAIVLLQLHTGLCVYFIMYEWICNRFLKLYLLSKLQTKGAKSQWRWSSQTESWALGCHQNTLRTVREAIQAGWSLNWSGMLVNTCIQNIWTKIGHCPWPWNPRAKNLIHVTPWWTQAKGSEGRCPLSWFLSLLSHLNPRSKFHKTRIVVRYLH